MTLREKFKIETGKFCAINRTRECSDERVFRPEYVEWLEKILQSTECEIPEGAGDKCKNYGLEFCPTCTHNMNYEDHFKA